MPDLKRLMGFGLLSWLVPLLASFLFYGPEGALSIDYDLFKSLMVVVGSGAGAALLVLYYRHIHGNYIVEAWIVGIGWLLLNWILDLLFLLPFSHQGPGEYFMQIGLRYLSILFTSLAVGYSLARAPVR